MLNVVSEAPEQHLLNAKLNLCSREFFLQYSRTPDPIGLVPLGQNLFEVERPDGRFHKIRSTLSAHEIVLCYALAALNWNGESIVDLGPLMGGSTWAFAKGLSDAGFRPEFPVIHSFDFWQSFASYQGYLGGYTVGGAASTLGQWTRTVEGYHSLIEPHQGEFLYS